MADWLDAVPVKQLPIGERVVVHTDAGSIALFNLAGELYAIEDVCSHDGGELASGSCDGDQIICPRHGARFCIKTGAVLTAPAYEDIETFPVRIESGIIQVDIDQG
ncbi:MAG: non-heme iron oxygenase ferredoxin subunit [Mariprofundaceae bacterium]